MVKNYLQEVTNYKKLAQLTILNTILKNNSKEVIKQAIEDWINQILTENMIESSVIITKQTCKKDPYKCKIPNIKLSNDKYIVSIDYTNSDITTIDIEEKIITLETRRY